MIIPIKCVTCGKPIAGLYRYYQSRVCEEKKKQRIPLDKVIYLTTEFKEKTIEGVILDEMGLKKPCCRTVMLTHVNIE